MATLGPENNNVNIDGGETSFVDFGGVDTYTILPSLSANVTITDNQASKINLPAGMDISAVRFADNSVEFTINGFTVTFIGDPSLFSFVFGGTPIKPTLGTPKSFAETAAAFGTTIPNPGEPTNSATITGPVNAQGTVGTPATVPVISIASTAAAFNEGETATFTVTTNAAAGSEVSYDLSGVSAADVVGGLTGTASVAADGTATISVALVEDELTEGTETLTVSVNNGAASASSTVNDTSTTPVPPAPTPTFGLTAGATSVNEGGTATFTLNTTNIAAGTSVPYAISGVSAADIAGGLTGNAVVDANGAATISIGVLADGLTEGTETLTVSVNNGGTSASATINDTSITPAPTPTPEPAPAPTFSLTADAASFNEGEAATFTLTTTDVASETSVPYTITGVSAKDVTAGLTGTAIVGANGTATISVALVADKLTEGPETLTVSLNNGTASANTTVNDTSVSPAPTNGAVIDGKISGATVFIDRDGDGVLDAGEPTTTTDAQGNFSFPEGTPGGALVAVGGTDISTGLPFTGKMTAPAGATVVTPITTLIDRLAAQDTDPNKDAATKVAEAQSKLKTLLGLDAVAADLTQTDFVAQSVSGDATGEDGITDRQAADVYAKAVQIINVVKVTQSAIKGAQGDGALTDEEISDAAFGALVQQLNALEDAPLADGADALTDAGFLTNVVQSTVDAQLGNAQDAKAKADAVVSGASAILASANTRIEASIDALASDATGENALGALVDLVKVGKAAQGQIADGISQATGSDNPEAAAGALQQQVTQDGGAFSDDVVNAQDVDDVDGDGEDDVVNGASDARINELHYDNTGADVGEFIEVRVTAGTDVSASSVELYNGNDGGLYGSILGLPSLPTSTQNGFDYYLIELPSNGLQNGAPDGVALINNGTVVEFLSYEGTFIATDGTAAGLTSTDIDVTENSDTPVGAALERAEDGDAWSVTDTDTRGLNNDTPPPFVGRINELHYDNTGADVGEFIEVRVAAGTDVSAASVELYNGNDGGLYGSILRLPSLPTSTQNGFDYYLIELPSNGLQNGAPDGLALINNGTVVEFLSYEGTFEAVDGTAAGVSSTDIGVEELASTPVGQSLQRLEGDTWDDPRAETRGSANDDITGPQPAAAPYGFDFETEFSTNGWQAVSVDSDTANTWFTDSFSGDSFAEVNGFGDAVPANDWLISPLIDISGLTAPIVRFANTKNFDDTGLADPEVRFLYSTDYSGTGDPTAVTWTELPYTASPGGFAETLSGNLDLSGVAGNQVYFAFQYQSTGTGASATSLWQIDDFFVGDDAPTPAETTLISAVQGTGDSSPIEGAVVTVEAVVVGDFQDGAFGTNGDLNGFYIQEEDADADADALSSEGVFVFDGTSPLVDVRNGDLVRVTGTVTEFFGETQISNVTSVEIISAGTATPSAAEVVFPVNVTTNANGEFIPDLEQFEGMLVTLPQEMTVSDLFTLGRFGDIGLQQGGLLETFTQANTPSVADFALYQQNAVANSILLDDGFTTQNPSVVPFEIAGVPGNVAGAFDAADPLSAGDTVTGLTGVVRFGTGSGSSGDSAFRINPMEMPQFVDTNPRETTAPDVGGSVTVSAFNLLNFFTSLGNEGLTSGPGSLEVRGADNLEEFDRQLDKLIATLSSIEADVFGLIELENEIGDQNGDGEFAIQVLVDALNSAIPGATYDFVDPGQPYVGGDAIMVGMIYDTNAVRIAPGTTVQVLTDADLPDLGLNFGNPVFDGSGTSRAPLAATFEEIATGETFTVVVNHFKSKGSVSPFGDNAGIGDGTGNNNEARLQAAQALDTWLNTDPTGSGDLDFLIIGDLNAYGMEDPITFLKSQGYEDQVEAFLPAGGFAYSFGFPVDLDTSPSVQNFGALDYALATGSLSSQVTGAAEWQINSVEASVLDFNTNFKSSSQVNTLYEADPFRSSDHDPLIVGLNLGTSIEIA